MEEFLRKIRNDHTDFEHGNLNDQLKNVNPIELFKEWTKEALDKGCAESNAMTISTVSKDNRPSARVVYLKEMKEEGLVFYTNYKSRKAKDIAVNPQVSVQFFWPELSRQIAIQGVCKKVDAKLSDAYFSSRPRGSQIGAWASNQSEKIEDRAALEKEIQSIEQLFEGKEIKRPPFWGGYIVQPLTIEFWQGRPSRLHDRFRFERENPHDEWKVARLAP